MRKFYLTLALLALPLMAAHACGGDDSMPSGTTSGSSTVAASGSVTGSGAATGSSTTSGSTTTGTGGSAGR